MSLGAYELNFNENGVNIIIKKAFEGDVSTVNALLELTAANRLSDAVYGYAYGGHVPLVDALIKQKPELSLAAARGYARANNQTQLSALPNSETLKLDSLIGAAQVFNQAIINKALGEEGGLKYLPQIVEGLATTNKAIPLLQLTSTPVCYQIALKTAARSGHRNLVGLLFEKLGIKLAELPNPLNATQKANLSYALEGYTEGRHFSEAIKLMILGVNPIHCLNKLARDGRLDIEDANLLLGMTENTTLKSKLMALMSTQFGLEASQLKPETSKLVTSLDELDLRVKAALKTNETANSHKLM